MGTDTPSDREPVAGRYTLKHIVGAGATAIVYEGSDLATDRPVAVKVYRPDGAARYRLQQRREIVALTRLRHPGLVALYDGGTEPGPGGRIYLVTELVEGPSLAERLMNGPLDVRSVRDLAARLAAALAHVHARGFIHRDIKPANILLDHDHEPRLADFGIARALDDTIATATGAVPGTAAYLAPEQVRGAPVEPAADVYALGLVLVEALTGRREYPGTVIESATARLHRRPVVPPGLPWNLTALLEAMTDLEPAWRPTAAAVTNALATATSPLAPAAAMPAALSRAEAPLAAPPACPRPRVRPLGKAPVLVAAAAAVVLAFLLGGALLFITTARSTIPALASIGAATTSSSKVSGGAPPVPTSLVPPPAAAAATAIPLEVGHPDNVVSAGSYTRTAQVPAINAGPVSAHNVQTASDHNTSATTGHGNSTSNTKANGNAKGKGKAKGKGSGTGRKGK